MSTKQRKFKVVVEELEDGEVLIDADLFHMLEEMGESSGESPGQVLSGALHAMHDEFKKAGKIGDA
jgi:hypothetical protein